VIASSSRLWIIAFLALSMARPSFAEAPVDAEQVPGSGDNGPQTGMPSRLTLDFDEFEIARPPTGFSAALTGGGPPPSWEIRNDASAPSGTKVLLQVSSDATNYRFPLCVYENWSAKDVEVSVRFKPISGQVDQAAGLVWRYQDADNYYVVRANALEDNVVLYKVERGRRSDLKPKGSWFGYGKTVEVPRGMWSVLRVRARGSQFDVWLDDEHLFQVEDKTFSEPGMVGLWTKADSVTAFDDLIIKRIEAE
jgi:hypothetical protein